MEALLPGVPYQYSQYYYLKDIAKPIVKKDRKLKTELKKNLRGIREYENALAIQASLQKCLSKIRGFLFMKS